VSARGAPSARSAAAAAFPVALWARRNDRLRAAVRGGQSLGQLVPAALKVVPEGATCKHTKHAKDMQ